MKTKTKRRMFVALGLAGLALLVTGWYLSSIRDRALKAKTRAQFSQWALAMEMFNAKYGAYPKVDGTYAGGLRAPDDIINSERFAVALNGRHLDGSDADLRAPTAGAALKVGNTKLIQFISLAAGEIGRSGSTPVLRDYFGNTEIAVLYDRNGDGVIDKRDLHVAPDVSPKGRPGQRLSPDIDLDKGIRAPVAFYSAGRGRSSADIIYSWK
jgi:hypothetical protein